MHRYVCFKCVIAIRNHRRKSQRLSLREFENRDKKEKNETEKHGKHEHRHSSHHKHHRHHRHRHHKDHGHDRHDKKHHRHDHHHQKRHHSHRKHGSHQRVSIASAVDDAIDAFRAMMIGKGENTIPDNQDKRSFYATAGSTERNSILGAVKNFVKTKVSKPPKSDGGSYEELELGLKDESDEHLLEKTAL